MIIVAEVGSNYCGSLDLALEHIEAAAKAGADAVKFQLFVPELLDSRPEVQQQLKPYVLKPGWLRQLRATAHDYGLKFIITPFDLDSCRQLAGLVDMVKISAYDLTYDALLQEAAKLDVPMVISTAMATQNEVLHARQVIWDAVDDPRKASRNYWLHGVAKYPAFPIDHNLKAILHLPGRYGLSDHTEGYEVAKLATALGASMIEKHFKLNDKIDSPDAPHSANPQQFEEMVNQVTLVKAILGDGLKKEPLSCEMPLYETCRRSNNKPLRG